MSRRLPALTPTKVIRALKRGGFVLRRVRGSHYQFVHEDDISRRVTVPYHNRDLKRPTLRAIITQSELTIDEFLDLL